MHVIEEILAGEAREGVWTEMIRLEWFWNHSLYHFNVKSPERPSRLMGITAAWSLLSQAEFCASEGTAEMYDAERSPPFHTLPTTRETACSPCGSWQFSMASISHFRKRAWCKNYKIILLSPALSRQRILLCTGVCG